MKKNSLCLRLYSTTIPAYAETLDKLDRTFPASTDPAQVFQNVKLIENIHRTGINLRHLALLREYVSSPRIKKILLVELMSRTIKNFVRKQLREEQEMKIFLSEEQVRRE